MAEAAYVVLIPARLGSSRLPNKPLADLAGVPMVVRVAQQAKASAASQVVVAADHPSIVQACEQHGIEAILTRDDHPSGSDRLAEAAGLLGLSDSQIVVNVQGDERVDVQMSTLAHPITEVSDWTSPHVVKVVLSQTHLAHYFSRASIPCWRDGSDLQLPPHPVYRHVGLYAYRCGFLKVFPQLAEAPT